MQTITLRNAPDVARVVRAAYGGYTDPWLQEFRGHLPVARAAKPRG